MAINFPNTPSNGSTYTYNGITYIYVDSGGGLGYWKNNTLGTATSASTPDVNAGTDQEKYVTPEALEGSKYTVEDGTYPNLRAQATSKADVGLSSVANYGASSSVSSSSSSTYATSAAAKTAYDRGSSGITKANAAQTTANTGVSDAATAQSRADSAYNLARGRSCSSKSNYSNNNVGTSSTALQTAVAPTGAKSCTVSFSGNVYVSGKSGSGGATRTLSMYLGSRHDSMYKYVGAASRTMSDGSTSSGTTAFNYSFTFGVTAGKTYGLYGYYGTSGGSVSNITARVSNGASSISFH